MCLQVPTSNCLLGIGSRMQLTFLGTGSAMPTGTRFQTGLLLEAGDDTLLIDCGSGVIHGLARTDVGYEGADTLVLTHHHLDHVSDLLVLLKARWLAGETEMTIAGPTGTEQLVRDLLAVHDYMEDRISFSFHEFDSDDEYSLNGFSLRTLETRHSMPCLAYRIDHPSTDRPFVFSGDSEAFEALIEFADGASVLVHDCSFPDSVDVSNHPTPSQLGETLASAEPTIDKVYLTHLYPHTEGHHEEMLESLGAYYDGDVSIATDGKTVTW